METEQRADVGHAGGVGEIRIDQPCKQWLLSDRLRFNMVIYRALASAGAEIRSGRRVKHWGVRWGAAAPT